MTEENENAEKEQTSRGWTREGDQDWETFEKSFSNVKPEGDAIERIELLRETYKETLSTIIAVSDRTPNRTIALRKLEESLMYAVKNIVLEGA